VSVQVYQALLKAVHDLALCVAAGLPCGCGEGLSVLNQQLQHELVDAQSTSQEGKAYNPSVISRPMAPHPPHACYVQQDDSNIMSGCLLMSWLIVVVALQAGCCCCTCCQVGAAHLGYSPNWPWAASTRPAVTFLAAAGSAFLP
jgi:hypothetical protein